MKVFVFPNETHQETNIISQEALQTDGANVQVKRQTTRLSKCFLLVRELLRASAVALPQLSLVTQRCFDWRNSAVSASAICPSITAMFP